MNKITVLEFQGWVTNRFTVQSAGDYQLNCSPIHSYYIDGLLYLADIYSQKVSSTILFLEQGSHFLDIRVRAKGNLQFHCSIKKIMSGEKLKLGSQTFSSRGSECTDLLEGQLPFNISSWIQLPVTNLDTTNWITNLEISINPSVNNKVDKQIPIVEIINNKSVIQVSQFNKLAPGHTQYFPFQFSLNTKLITNINWWKQYGDNKPCITFSVVITGSINQDVYVSNPTTIKLTCRHAKQSFIFTFPDHDGSISHAGSIQPRIINKYHHYPVLLALSGVGVSTRSQADSYKYKSSSKDKDYTFGFDNIWVFY